MTTNIYRAALCMAESAAREFDQDPTVIPYLANRNLPRAKALADATPPLLMPDLPDPVTDNDGWVLWDSSSVTEAGYHPEKGLWTYDDGRMVQDSPERLREVAYIYLAAADYAERNQE